MTEPIHHETDREKEDHNKLVLSFMTLRNLVGFVGFFLPSYLILFTIVTPADELPMIKGKEGDLPIQGSISDYFYTSSGDIFELSLCTCCILIMVYAGYNWKERLLCYISALGGLGVAVLPTKWKDTCKVSIHNVLVDPDDVLVFPGTDIEIHFILAGIFLVGLAILSIKFFPLSSPDSIQSLKPGNKKTQKEKRNRIYKACGWIMLGSVFACIIYVWKWEIIDPLIGKFPMIFFWETVALFAFAISWLTKGETFYPDGDHYIITGIKMAKHALIKNKKPDIK